MDINDTGVRLVIGIALIYISNLLWSVTRPAPPQTMGDAYAIIGWAAILAVMTFIGAMLVLISLWSLASRHLGTKA